MKYLKVYKSRWEVSKSIRDLVSDISQDLVTLSVPRSTISVWWNLKRPLKNSMKRNL